MLYVLRSTRSLACRYCQDARQADSQTCNQEGGGDEDIQTPSIMKPSKVRLMSCKEGCNLRKLRNLVPNCAYGDLRIGGGQDVGA